MWLPKPVIAGMLLRFLEEDLGLTDVTTSLLIDEGVEAEGVVVAKEDGVAAGLEEARILAETIGLKVEYSLKDGERFSKGDILLKLRGDARSMLVIERTMLNILSRMCGIATATRKIVDKVREAGLNVRVAATRKIPPGLRYLDKKAVKIGGGDTHRLRLEDTILIKDNHIALVGSVRKAVEKARVNAGFTYKIEVEVTNVEEAVEAAEAGADIIMLDNFTIDMVEEAVKLLEERGLRGKVILEVSGGIESILNKAMYDEVRDRIYSVALELGGVITGEHGIGFVRRYSLLRFSHPIYIDLIRRIKQVFDPNNILNPDKLLP